MEPGEVENRPLNYKSFSYRPRPIIKTPITQYKTKPQATPPPPSTLNQPPRYNPTPIRDTKITSKFPKEESKLPTPNEKEKEGENENK